MTATMALYIGEAGNFLRNGTPLIPGVTIAAVPDGEAEASDLWSPIDAGDPTDAAPPSIIDGGSFRLEVVAQGSMGYVSPAQLAVLDGGAP